MRILLAAVLAAPLVAVPAETAVAAPGRLELYVAPGGKDSWPGTIKRPFATVGRAQRAVRAKTAGMRSDIVVNLRGGTYGLTAPLRLSAPGDSGRNGHRVVYQAYGYGTRARERVTISGGRTITGWRSAGGVWRADVGGLDTRQLYVNGRRAERTSLGGAVPGKLTRTKSGYLTDSTAPRSWRAPKDMELVYTGAFGYAEGRCGVAGISAEGRRTRITVDQPCFDRSKKLYEYDEENPGTPLEFIDPTGVENSPSFLRRPGSWYLDRSRPGRHVLSYLPRQGEDPRRAQIVAPVLETLVTGDGTHDVSFKGLTFAYATWRVPSGPGGFPQIFGSWYYAGGSPDANPLNGRVLQVPGNVALRKTKRITFEGNRFTHLGARALGLSGLSERTLVRGNVVDDVSGGGIELEGTAAGRGNRVENNWVHHIGNEYRGGIGIGLAGLDSTVAHNQVNDTPYSGIVIGDLGTARGVRVLDNQVFGTNRTLIDGGGIYTSADQGTSFANGALIRGNVVHDVLNRQPGSDFPIPIGIYNDNEGDWITSRGNVVYGNRAPLGGVAPKRIRFEGNFWDDDKPMWWPPSPGVKIRDNTLLPRDKARQACEAISACAAILANAGLQQPYRSLLKG